MAKVKITCIATDELDEDFTYYLYEVETDNLQYYVTRCNKDFDNENDERDYSNVQHMYDRNDFNDREWEIAKYLFKFLWDSSNGINTACDQDVYEDDGFSHQEMVDFIEKFDFETKGALEIDTYDEGAIEIYWEFFSCFNLKTCSFFED